MPIVLIFGMVAAAFYKHYSKSKRISPNVYYTFKLLLTPGNDSTFDPPPIVTITKNGEYQFWDDPCTLQEFRKDLPLIAQTQPYDLRGFRLKVAPNQTLQQVISLLDEFFVASEIVKHQSIGIYQTSGSNIYPKFWFDRDTFEPYNPSSIPPPVEISPNAFLKNTKSNPFK